MTRKTSDASSEGSNLRLSTRLTMKAAECLDSACASRGVNRTELVNSMLETLDQDEPEEMDTSDILRSLHSGQEHVTQWTPRNCPECGIPNRAFKDEVKCRSCGISLGSEEYAHNKMKSCPNCGETEYGPVSGYELKYPPSLKD